MSDIFISHAVADQPLAKLLVGFLKEAIGVPEKSIFCSSVKGHHIPLGEDFNAYIKQKIQKPELVILLMTPAYMESSFCLMELGAAWAQDATSLAVVVPPISYDTVTKTLGLKQAWNITDKKGLVDLRELVAKSVTGIESRSEHTWDDKRTHWGVSLKKLLLSLQQFTKVDADEHEGVLEELKEKGEEIERLEKALATTQEKYSELEKAKDKDEVKALKRKTAGSQALENEFDSLLKDVKEARPEGTAMLVFKHLILDHYGIAGQINWYDDKYEFDRAVSYGLMSPEDTSVLWNRPKLKRLRKSLEAVDAFLNSEEGQKFQSFQDSDVPTEPADLGFWEHHLDI